MKKQLSIVVALATAALVAMVALGGCAAQQGPTPSDVVAEGLDAIKSQDAEKIQKSFNIEVSEEDVSNAINEATGGAAGEQADQLASEITTELTQGLGNIDLSQIPEEQRAAVEALIARMCDFDYEVVKETVNGETATVDVALATYDFGAMLTGAITTYFTEALTTTFSGGQMDEATAAALFGKVLDEELAKQGEKSKKSVTSFHLSKIEGAWKIDELSEDNIDCLLGGLASEMQGLADSLGALDLSGFDLAAIEQSTDQAA